MYEFLFPIIILVIIVDIIANIIIVDIKYMIFFLVVNIYKSN